MRLRARGKEVGPEETQPARGKPKIYFCFQKSMQLTSLHMLTKVINKLQLYHDVTSCPSGIVRIGVARPLTEDYEEEVTGESPPDTTRECDEAQFKRESEYFISQ